MRRMVKVSWGWPLLAIPILFSFGCISKMCIYPKTAVTVSIDPEHPKAKNIKWESLKIPYNDYTIAVDRYSFNIHVSKPYTINTAEIKLLLSKYIEVAKKFNIQRITLSYYAINKHYLPNSYYLWHPQELCVVSFDDKSDILAEFISSLAVELHEGMHENVTKSDKVRWFKEGTCDIPYLEYYFGLNNPPIDDYLLRYWTYYNKNNYNNIIKWSDKSKVGTSKNDINRNYYYYFLSTYACLKLYLTDPNSYIKVVNLTKGDEKLSQEKLAKYFKDYMNINIYDFNQIQQLSSFKIAKLLNKVKNNSNNAIIIEYIDKIIKNEKLLQSMQP